MFGRREMTHEFDGKKYEKASDHQKEWGTRLIAELNLKDMNMSLISAAVTVLSQHKLQPFFLKVKC